MTTRQVSLPEPLNAFLDELVAEGTFQDPDEYLRILIDRDRRARLERTDPIESLLMEGLESGPSTPMTPERWDQIRQEGLRIIAGRRAAKKAR